MTSMSVCHEDIFIFSYTCSSPRQIPCVCNILGEINDSDSDFLTEILGLIKLRSCSRARSEDWGISTHCKFSSVLLDCILCSCCDKLCVLLTVFTLTLHRLSAGAHTGGSCYNRCTFLFSELMRAKLRSSFKGPTAASWKKWNLTPWLSKCQYIIYLEYMLEVF